MWRARLLVLTVAVIAVALAGYGGYVAYPRFAFLPVEGAAVLGLAVVGGVAALFSPCSFPLLLTLLGRGGAGRRRTASAAAMAIGAAALLVLVGAAIAVGGRTLIEQVTFDSPTGIALRAVVGAVLIVLGLVQARLMPNPLAAGERAARPILRLQAAVRRRRPLLGFGLFGFGYVLAGFG